MRAKCLFLWPRNASWRLAAMPAPVTLPGLGAFILCLLISLTGCTGYLFYPMKQQYLTPEVVGISYDDLYLQTTDGLQLHGWKLHAKEDAVATVLYLHGNAENISTHFGNVYWLTDHAYDVILFDYRGYGLSEGLAELDGIIDDAGLMIRYAVDHDTTGRLIVMGQSLGASISIYAVANTAYHADIDSLVSVAGFSDYRAVTQDVLSRNWLTWLFQWPFSFAMDNSYSPVRVIDRVSPIPVLVMHSRTDEIIEFYHAERLYEAASQPKQLIEIDSGHNNAFQKEANRRLLLDYLDGL